MNDILTPVISLALFLALVTVLFFVFRVSAAQDKARKEARMRELDDAPFGEVTDTNQKLREMSEKHKNNRGLDRISRFGG